MTHLGDSFAEDVVVVGGVEYYLTHHVKLKLEERSIEREWIVDVLENWVARKLEASHDSINYFGPISGRSRLFMVCVSSNRPAITTAYFNSAATVQYRRNEYSYFDEVRGGPES